MVIMMREFGRSLVTRASGRQAYDSISRLVMSGEGVVTFDFDGVETITNSFSDEVFGRLAYELGMEELRSRTSFVNISSFWARVVRNAMDAREAQRPLYVC